MNFRSAEGRVPSLYPFMLILLWSATAGWAQAVHEPVIPPADREMLVFRIRSAFLLTPPMVASLQSRTGENTAGTSAGAAAGAAAAAPAPAQRAESAAVPQSKSSDIPWGEALIRDVPFSVPIDVRLVGKNVLALVQIVPVETGSSTIELLVQGQVWVKMPDGSVSVKTSFQSMSIVAGMKLYYYPLGVDLKNGAPIAVEIKIDRPARP